MTEVIRQSRVGRQNLYFILGWGDRIHTLFLGGATEFILYSRVGRQNWHFSWLIGLSFIPRGGLQ
jgi:hypothetical protein